MSACTCVRAHARTRLCEVMDALTNLTMVIVLQHVHIVNPPIVPLQYVQFIVSIMPQ
jgi:hypothetical protein